MNGAAIAIASINKCVNEAMTRSAIVSCRAYDLHLSGREPAADCTARLSARRRCTRRGNGAGHRNTACYAMASWNDTTLKSRRWPRRPAKACFLPCSFWPRRCLCMCGRLKEAQIAVRPLAGARATMWACWPKSTTRRPSDWWVIFRRRSPICRWSRRPANLAHANKPCEQRSGTTMSLATQALRYELVFIYRTALPSRKLTARGWKCFEG